MLERGDSSLETPAGSASRLGDAGPSVEAPAPDPRIEEYLDHVCAPLLGLVPYARRQELRAELRGHLEALVATHEELGSPRDAAVVLALRQFGPPRHLSRQWAREWVHGAAPASLQPPWRAMRVALGSFGLVTLLALVLYATAAAIPAVGSSAVLGLLVLGSIGVLLPVMAGIATGLLAPARHALGTFFALSLVILFCASLALQGMRLPGPVDDPASGLGLVIVQAVLWIPLGCVAAALGGSLRTRMSERPQPWALQ